MNSVRGWSRAAFEAYDFWIHALMILNPCLNFFAPSDDPHLSTYLTAVPSSILYGLLYGVVWRFFGWLYH